MNDARRTLRDVLSDAMAEYKTEYPTVRAVAAAMGLATATVYDYLQGFKKTPKPATLRQMAAVFPKYAVAIYEAAGEPVPHELIQTEARSYCETAKAIAAKLGITKEEAINQAVEQFARQLSVPA